MKRFIVVVLALLGMVGMGCGDKSCPVQGCAKTHTYLYTGDMQLTGDAVAAGKAVMSPEDYVQRVLKPHSLEEVNEDLNHLMWFIEHSPYYLEGKKVPPAWRNLNWTVNKRRSFIVD